MTKEIQYVDSNGRLLSRTEQSLKEQVADHATQLAEIASNVKSFGAVGDGVHDDTTAIQNAINACATTKTTLFFPEGNYKITSALQLPSYIRIRGVNHVYGGYGTYKPNCSIDVYGLIAFQPNVAGVVACTIDMEGMAIQSLGTNVVNSVAFDSIKISSSYISKCLFFQFGTIFHGTINAVSDIHDCVFEGVGKYFIYHDDILPTDSTIVDSFIHHNYINGKPDNNATCFQLYYPTTSIISNNYIDFFKIIFNFEQLAEDVTISDNIFDYCYRGFIGKYSLLNIKGNTFRHFQKANASYFPNADTQMLNNNWVCFECTAYDLVAVNLIANLVDSCDQWININDIYAIIGFTSKLNMLKNVTTPIYYLAELSGTTGDQTGIFIEELNNQTFTTLPNASLTSGAITTFNKQEAFYNGKKIYNNNGTWNDMLGNVVT